MIDKPKKVAVRRRETRAISKSGLTETEQEFVKHYTNPNSPTYRNGTLSLMAVKPTIKKTTAQVAASQMIRKKDVNRALREILDTPNYKQLIHRRLTQILEDETARPRDILGAMDFHAKITGAYSPEKHMNMNLTPEDRDARYKEILAKVRGEQAKQLPEPAPTTASAVVVNPVPATIDLPEGPDASPPQPILEDDSQEDEDAEDEEAFLF